VTGKGSKERNVHQSDILTYEELDRLICASEDLEETAFVLVGVTGGLRLAEILGLRRCDIYDDPPSVLVRGETAKRDKERIVPVTPVTVALLRGLSTGGGDEALIFTRQRRAYQARMERLGERAGVKRKVTPHMLRHTAATMQIDLGVDLETVRDNLGHESIKTTQDYLHLNIRSRSRKYLNALRMVL